MKSSADQEGCYSQRPKVDNTLRDLQFCSYPTKAEFNNCKIYKTAQFTVAPSESLTCLFLPEYSKTKIFSMQQVLKLKNSPFFNIFIFKF